MSFRGSVSLEEISNEFSRLEEKVTISGFFSQEGIRPGPEDVHCFVSLFGYGNQAFLRWAKNISSFSESERQEWKAVQ